MNPVTHYPWLCRFSLLVVLATLILIAAGGLVTSHEAGLAVPDWPTSFGQWFPPMVGNVLWEHGHRMIAGTVGILVLILTLWVHCRERRPGLRILAWTAFGGVITQAVLGGLTVVFMQPPVISILHACLAQTLFCLVIAVAYFLRETSLVPQPSSEKAAKKGFLRTLSVMTVGFLYLQLILGAMVRHTGRGVAFHILTAFLVFFLVLWLVMHISQLSSTQILLSRASLAAGILMLIQFFLGIGAFIFTRVLARGYAPSRGEVVFTAAHQTVGAVILGLCFLIALRAHR